MAKLAIQQINSRNENAAQKLAELQRKLSSHGEVISEKGRQLTIDVFGEPLPPKRVVERVCQDVRDKGLSALLQFTEKFDRVDLTSTGIRVSQDELANAHELADAKFLSVIRQAKQNILSFQSGLIATDAVLRIQGRQELRVRYRPMKRIGVCVPGGAAAYPSTLLMTVCPARAAGVPEIVVVMPPTPFGAYNNDLLATCYELGVKEVYRIGGAQAVAAMAYGVDGLRPVDMIVGPGNIFVTLAKKFVFGDVAIDCLAGPSEVIVVADETAEPDYVASDLIAQAEHDPGTSILITWDEKLIPKVLEHLETQLSSLSRADATRRCLEKFGALVEVRNESEALALVNQLGPEHLHVSVKNSAAFVDKVENAGAIFVGNYTPVALGDYAAGPSHVLPTGGTCRFTNGLASTDFLKRSSILHFSREGLEGIGDAVCHLATKEGLTGHAESVSIRRNVKCNGKNVRLDDTHLHKS